MHHRKGFESGPAGFRSVKLTSTLAQAARVQSHSPHQNIVRGDLPAVRLEYNDYILIFLTKVKSTTNVIT